MRKRKINPQYLRHITSQDVKDEKIDSLDFALSIKRFADDYLRGIMQVVISGTPRGTVSIKLPVASYLIRLLAECADNDDLVELDITLGDKLTIRADYNSACKSEDVATVVKVAKLAGFEVARDGNSLFFSAKAVTSSVLQVYANSGEDFLNLLITTHKM